MFATKVVIGVNKRLISPSVIEQSAHGVQKRIWREEYKMKREKTTAIKKAIKDKIERLRLIRDELNTTVGDIMKQKNVEVKLRNWLLLGKEISHNQALRRWRSNRLAEFIRRLRKKGYKIITEMVSDRKTGDRYGVYYMDPLFLRSKRLKQH